MSAKQGFVFAITATLEYVNEYVPTLKFLIAFIIFNLILHHVLKRCAFRNENIFYAYLVENHLTGYSFIITFNIIVCYIWAYTILFQNLKDIYTSQCLSLFTFSSQHCRLVDSWMVKLSLGGLNEINTLYELVLSLLKTGGGGLVGAYSLSKITRTKTRWYYISCTLDEGGKNHYNANVVEGYARALRRQREIKELGKKEAQGNVKINGHFATYREAIAQYRIFRGEAN